MELHELGLTNRDSQWIEARGFSAEEICRFFGVHPHMIGVKSSAPLGSIEQQSLEFVLYTLGPLAVRFEQAANRDLLEDPETFYTKIVLDALLRADLKSRYEAHNISVQGGWGLINEVREIEDRNPIEGGDEPRFPMNMQPAGGSPDEREQGGQPGKGLPKAEPAELPPPEETKVEPVELTAHEQLRLTFEILLREAASRVASYEIQYLEERITWGRQDRPRWNDRTLKFYSTKLPGYITKTITPICLAWKAQTGVLRDAVSIGRVIISQGPGAFDPDRDPADLLEEWKQTRAGEHGDRLCDLFFGE